MKLPNIRNTIAIIFTVGFFSVLGTHFFISDFVIPEILLGAMIVQITLIVQFFFRRSKPQ